MSIIDKLLGRPEEPAQGAYADRPPVQTQPGARNRDEEAVERYRYMLRTAPPEQIERAHEEAFAKLTPEQRKLALGQLSQELPDYERPQTDDPRELARAATRAEIRQPGTLNRAFGGGMGYGGGMGFGTMMAGSLLTSMAGAFIGSAIANQFFGNPSHENGFQNDAANDNGTAADQSGNVADNASFNEDPAGDPANESSASFNEGSVGDSGFDMGGDFGSDIGSDFGGDF